MKSDGFTCKSCYYAEEERGGKIKCWYKVPDTSYQPRPYVHQDDYCHKYLGRVKR